MNWKNFTIQIYYTYEGYNGYSLQSSTIKTIKARNKDEAEKILRKKFHPPRIEYINRIEILE